MSDSPGFCPPTTGVIVIMGTAAALFLPLESLHVLLNASFFTPPPIRNLSELKSELAESQDGASKGWKLLWLYSFPISHSYSVSPDWLAFFRTNCSDELFASAHYRQHNVRCKWGTLGQNCWSGPSLEHSANCAQGLGVAAIGIKVASGSEL